MNLKKTWNKKYGKSEIITKENSTLKNVEIDMVRLADGQTKAYDEKDTEFGIVIFGGKCKISGDGFDFGEIGKRKDVFDGPCTCVYVPKDTKFSITGVGEVSMCVAKSPSWNVHKPVLIKPEDVICKNLGQKLLPLDNGRKKQGLLYDNR